MQPKNNQTDISIVIPVLNERQKIAADIKAAGIFLTNHNLSGEIIVVDDGSNDGSSEVAKHTTIKPDIILKAERYKKHRGKGHAISTGMKQTSGEYVMFADSGCCVPYENVLRGLELIKNGLCDIAHGSRKLGQSKILKPQTPYRRFCSAIFHWFVICAMKIPSELTDTQCGFKIYRGDTARQLYSQCITDGFMFDIEIIMRALKQGLQIKEFPIEWTCDRDSRLSPTRSLLRILLELINIRKTLVKPRAK